MSITSDIRQYLIDNSILSADECKLNIADTSDEQVVLWLNGGEPVDFGIKPTIQIQVYSLDIINAENKINSIFNALVADDTVKYKLINNKKTWITAQQQPYFLEKDSQNRFIWVFNITVITNR